MSRDTSTSFVPYGAVRIIRKYKPRLREVLLSHVQKHIETTGRDALTIDDLQHCLNLALDDLERDIQSKENLPEPDAGVIHESLEDFRAGRWKRVEDVIDGCTGG